VQFDDVVLQHGVEHFSEFCTADASRDFGFDLLDFDEVVLQVPLQRVALVLVLFVVLAEDRHVFELVGNLGGNVVDRLFLELFVVEQVDVLLLPHEQVGEVELDFERVVQVLFVQFADGLTDVDAFLLDARDFVLDLGHLLLHFRVALVEFSLVGARSETRGFTLVLTRTGHLVAQVVNFLTQIFNDGFVLRDVHGHQSFVLVGLNFDFLGAVGLF